MSRAELHIGDVFEVLATLEPGSVDLVMSSPPFLALRSYLPADHPDKGKEIGSEPTPGEFIDTMLDVVEACARVLAPHGSLVFELGDTYAGSGGAGGDYAEGGLRDGQPTFRQTSGWHRGAREGRAEGAAFRKAGTSAASPNGGNGWPLDKSKTLIPQLFAVALAYGFNPLTGRETEPWRVRNTVAWCRPNPPVGRDGDKFRPATSHLTVATRVRDRYWDGDAVRVQAQDYTPRNGAHVRDGIPGRQDQVSNAADEEGHRIMANPAGAPLLDWWNIPTAPYKGAHYATYPPDLVVPVVKAMCPLRVCRVCGKPSTRITETTQLDTGRTTNGSKPRDRAESFAGTTYETRTESHSETIGWTDCGHDDWRTGVVLDPFAGSGTTLQVATGHGRDAIGIDLDERNAALALERLGMFLTVIEREAASVSSHITGETG